MEIKLEMSKTYDRVEYGFFRMMLHKLYFYHTSDLGLPEPKMDRACPQGYKAQNWWVKR